MLLQVQIVAATCIRLTLAVGNDDVGALLPCGIRGRRGLNHGTTCSHANL